ncbi:hypothetical protein [Amycolatopsis solani]|uniref:hypothetical protein n=1 Tax=Amycolatopsis solani TaxID=3028615 RepID=UPI00296ED2FD|nr:hypothetical protein [Amycolatopsis sp. MEP2-6]
MGFLRRRRWRAQRSAHLSEVAEQIGARDGVVLKDRFSGGKGLNGPLTLGVITLRNGSAVEIAQAQIDAAVAAGYTDPPEPPCASGRGCGFVSTPGLPMVIIVTYEAGTVIPHHGEVPSGQTGVSVSLT